MKKPHNRKAAISSKRVAEWIKIGRYYRRPFGEEEVQDWLNRFSKHDKDIAARVLDVVDVISEQEILVGYRDALSCIDGWDIRPNRRVGRWYFVGFGGSGESGQSMLRQFREANKMTSATYVRLFCGVTELASLRLTSEDHVVFIDDFSGTGRQVSLAWPTMQELIASEATCHLVLTAATRKAILVIENGLDLVLSVHIVLEDEDNVFSSRCKYFTKKEQLIIEKYGKIANRKHPKGFGDCGLLFVLSHKTPNNAVPILHVYNDNWHGLFPRYLPLPN